jgi:hypothetical protein
MNIEGIEGGGGGGSHQPTTTMALKRGQGTPFAKELDERLRGDEPLPLIVLDWGEKYQAWRNAHAKDENFCGMSYLSDHEDSVYCLGLTWTLVGEDNLSEDDPNPDMQQAWGHVH